MYMEYGILAGNESTLASVKILRNDSVDTTVGSLARRGQVVLGQSSQFRLSKLAPRRDGWSISLKDLAEEEINGFKNIRSESSERDGSTRRREGSSRESRKDYLHFLYIARGSLSETQYFIHLACRLGYLPSDDAEALREQTKRAFGGLHGLIQAVERETGKLSKVVAAVTSLMVIGFARWSGGHMVS
jgi:hypothetical protein